MRNTEMIRLMEEYRQSCNRLTERIEEISRRLRSQVPQEEYIELSGRRRLLREERIELLRTMESLQEYCA